MQNVRENKTHIKYTLRKSVNKQMSQKYVHLLIVGLIGFMSQFMQRLQQKITYWLALRIIRIIKNT